MDYQQKEQLTATLKKQRDELRALLERHANKDAHVKDDFHARFPSYGDMDEENAEEVSDFEDEVSIDRGLEALLQATDEALAAIEKGTYGTCRVCGKEIDFERLSIVPSTTLCREHKGKR
ncbi:MAG: TraR/DksA C4-type zinc finger protein [bacterium]